jgi:glutamate synthase (NADPH/NADH) large chain
MPPLLDRQQAFGYTQEDLKLLMAPMAVTGQEAVGSMGTDTPVAVLSRKTKLLYNYFKQNFAQVTNPPIDPIREEIVMSLVSFIGPRPNLFDLEGLSERKRLEVRQPILTNADLEKIRAIGDIADNAFHTQTLDITVAVERGLKESRWPWRVCATAPSEPCSTATTSSSSPTGWSAPCASPFRRCSPRRRAQSPDPQRAADLGRARRGNREPREVHQFCLLAGYGAEAINPIWHSRRCSTCTPRAPSRRSSTPTR